MIFKILLNSIFVSLLVWPAASEQTGLLATVDSDNHVDYQQVQHYLPTVANKYPLPVKTSQSLGIVTSSDSAIVIDDASGQILWQKNPGQRQALASLVKLMTAYVFLQQDYDFDQVIEITDTNKTDPEESSLSVVKGEQITVYDLFLSALVGSANNATRELVYSLGYSQEQFVEMMNDTAKDLGMNDTTFTDVTGIDKGNRSTAADYIKLVRLAFNQEIIQQITVKPDHRFKSVSEQEHYVKNSNDLIGSDLDIVAGKTGFTYEAGYCLALKVADEDGNNVIILNLGSSSSAQRFADVKNLTLWTQHNYRWD